METNLKKINNGSVAKRLLALIMDAAVFAFTFLALMLFVFEPIADKLFDYSNNRELEYETRVFSKLVVLGEQLPNSEEIRIINNSEELKNVKGELKTANLREYQCEDVNKKERLKYYYCNYKTNTNLDFEKGTQDSKITVEVDGQEIDPVEYYNIYVEPVTDSKEIESLVIKAEIDLSKSDFLKQSVSIMIVAFPGPKPSYLNVS